MMQVIDPVRFDAFVRLLAEPDPTDLPHRGHVLRYAGDPNRRETRLPGILEAWLQRRHMAVDIEAPLAPAIRDRRPTVRRTHRGLRVLPPTGTDA